MNPNLTDLQISRISSALEIMYGQLRDPQNRSLTTKEIAKEMFNREYVEYYDPPSLESFRSKIIYRVLNSLSEEKLVEKHAKNEWNLTDKGLALGKQYFMKDEIDAELHKEFPILKTIEDSEIVDLSRSIGNRFLIHILLDDPKGDFERVYDILRASTTEDYNIRIQTALFTFFVMLKNEYQRLAAISTYSLMENVNEFTFEEFFESVGGKENIAKMINHGLLEDLYKQFYDVTTKIINEVNDECKEIVKKQYNEFIQNLDRSDRISGLEESQEKR